MTFSSLLIFLREHKIKQSRIKKPHFSTVELPQSHPNKRASLPVGLKHADKYNLFMDHVLPWLLADCFYV